MSHLVWVSMVNEETLNNDVDNVNLIAFKGPDLQMLGMRLNLSSGSYIQYIYC